MILSVRRMHFWIIFSGINSNVSHFQGGQSQTRSKKCKCCCWDHNHLYTADRGQGSSWSTSLETGRSMCHAAYSYIYGYVCMKNEYIDLIIWRWDFLKFQQGDTGYVNLLCSTRVPKTIHSYCLLYTSASTSAYSVGWSDSTFLYQRIRSCSQYRRILDQARGHEWLGNRWCIGHSFLVLTT